MTREQQFEQRLAEWIEDGPFLAPDRALEAAFAHAEAHPRRRFPLAGSWRSALGRLRPADAMPGSPRQSRISAFAAIGAAAVLFVGIIGGSAVLLTANRGGLPPAGPVVPASPTPT
ncbi:MAG: hypothetical protein MUQ32_12765, partial [Chloroflexi bacterium]|nr:hypothetical protein [Chloroflexota bacterium]